MRNSIVRNTVSVLACLIALGLFKACYDRKQQEIGALREKHAALEKAADSLKRVSRRVDSVYVADTVKLWRTVARAETLVTTLLRSDTVTLTKRESVLVFVADSLIGQCRTAVSSCEVRVRVRDSLNAVLTTDRNYWRGKSDPSLLTRMTTALKWAAIGYVAGRMQ